MSVSVLVHFAVAEENRHIFRGELPATMPQGAVLQVKIVDDLMTFSSVALATAHVTDGVFHADLPVELEPEQLQEMQVCGGGNINVALVTHIEVLVDDTAVGQLWRTNEAPGAWGMYGPSAYTYLAYVDEAVQLEDDCWGDVLELDLQPGWNLFTRIPIESGSLTTSAEPPEDFVWHYMD